MKIHRKFRAVIIIITLMALFCLMAGPVLADPNPILPPPFDPPPPGCAPADNPPISMFDFIFSLFNN